MVDPSLLALGLTVLAGLSTGIGSLIGLSSRRFGSEFLTLALGFSAGAMVYVSLVEILPKARLSLEPGLGLRLAYGAAVMAFLAGIGLMAWVDHLLPAHEAPAVLHGHHPPSGDDIPRRRRLLRMGLFSAVAIAIHNIPEGLAGYVMFRSFPNPQVFGLVFAAVAGVMVYVSLDELLPAARDYGEHRLAIASLLAGMSVMAISLVALA